MDHPPSIRHQEINIPLPESPSSGPLPATMNDVDLTGTNQQAARRPFSASSCATLLISIAKYIYPSTSPRQTTILLSAPCKLNAANRTSSTKGHHLGIPFKSGVLISIVGGSASRMTVYSAKTTSLLSHPVLTTSSALSASSSGTFQPSHSSPLSNFSKAKAAASIVTLAPA